MRMYQITATVTLQFDGGFESTRHIPTFHLNADIHGLLNEKAAANFARTMLMELLGTRAKVVSTFAIEV